MVIRLAALAFLFLALSSCSMPSVGYWVDLEFKGELNQSCVQKVFTQFYSKAKVNPKSWSYFGVQADTSISLEKFFTEPNKIGRVRQAVSHEGTRLIFTSYFVTSWESQKLLKKMKKSPDAVNFVSHKMHKDINRLVDTTIKDCSLKVLSKSLGCRPFGRNKKYFKCIE